MGICQTCGGVNGPSAARIVEDINTGAPNPWAFLCIGHDEPKPKHNGKLPGGDTYEVYYDGTDKDAYVCIQGTHNLSNYEVILEPQQALSLLSWLQQEQPTLEKMIGVEKGTPKG